MRQQRSRDCRGAYGWRWVGRLSGGYGEVRWNASMEGRELRMREIVVSVSVGVFNREAGWRSPNRWMLLYLFRGLCGFECDSYI